MNDAPHGRSRAILSDDTTAEAERLQILAWRRMSSVEKATMVSRATLAAQRLALAGVRLRYPDASDRECFIRVTALRLGPALTCRVYPDAAAILRAGR